MLYDINFLSQDTLPLAEALQSGHYHIKWTTCSDLPTPMYDAYVAVSNGTIYCSGTTPNGNNEHEVYSYSTRTNQWKQIARPAPGLGVLHIVDDKLTMFGGRYPITDEFHNKVHTYNSKSNSWYSHFPNMKYNRGRPGVLTTHEHVMVMGGQSNSDYILDNIEIMEYDNMLWREVSVRLPVQMFGFIPTISGDNIIILGYISPRGHSKKCYQIPTIKLLLSFDQSLSSGPVFVQWKEFSGVVPWESTTIPHSNPPVIFGGCNHAKQGSVPTSDISVYDKDKNTWRRVDSLSSARSNIGVSLITSSTIIVVGGCSKGGDIEAAMSSSLTKVEIGTVVPN